MSHIIDKIKKESTEENFAENLLKDVFNTLSSSEKSLRYARFNGERVPAWEYIEYLKRRYEIE